MFKKADVAEDRQFFEDLVAEVSSGMVQGKSLVELKQSIRLEKYRDWCAWMTAHSYTTVSNLRFGVELRLRQKVASMADPETIAPSAS